MVLMGVTGNHQIEVVTCHFRDIRYNGGYHFEVAAIVHAAINENVRVSPISRQCQQKAISKANAIHANTCAPP